MRACADIKLILLLLLPGCPTAGDANQNHGPWLQTLLSIKLKIELSVCFEHKHEEKNLPDKFNTNIYFAQLSSSRLDL